MAGRSVWIDADALPGLRRRVANMTARAKRLGLEAPELRELDNEGERVLVELCGEPPRLEGWRVVAELDHRPGSTRVRSLVGEQVSEAEWRDAEPRCDHCGLRRVRKTTLVLRHRSGDFAQVGTNCLEEFTGGAEPLAAVPLARAIARASGSSGEQERPEPSVREFLAAVCAVAGENGFVAAGAAGDGRRATSELAAERLGGGLTPSTEHLELAATVEAWVLHGLAEQADLEGYRGRLVSVYRRSERVGPRDRAMIASALLAYERERAAGAALEHLGAVGDSLELEVVVVRKKQTKRTRYGPRCWHELHDEAGHRLSWFAVGRELDVGGRYRLRGRVREHDEFQGEAVTVLERCRLVESLSDQG